MKIEKTPIQDLVIIEPVVFGDERGLPMLRVGNVIKLGNKLKKTKDYKLYF